MLQSKSLSQGNIPGQNLNAQHNLFFRSIVPVALVFLIVLALRFYLTYPVNPGGDAFVKWYRIKLGLHGLGWGGIIDHHQLRWAMNLPSVLIQMVLGSQPSAYYIPSAVLGAVGSVFMFLIVRFISNTWIALLAVFLYSIEPRMTYAASQFLPGIYTSTYVLGLACFLLLYCFKPERKPIYLALSILFMFLAYGAKVPNLFFLPGVLVILYWKTGSWRTILIFLASLFVLFLAETTVITLLTGEFHILGRVSFLKHHMARMQKEAYQLSDIWLRWDMLPTYWKLLLGGALLSGFYAFFKRKDQHWAMVLSVFILLFSFVLITTFAVTDLDPLKFAQPLHVRYLLVTIPLAFIVVCTAFHLVHFSMPVAVAALLCWVWFQDYRKNELKIFEWQPAVSIIDDYQRTISNHWRAGYILIFKHRKYAKLYRDVYLTDDILFKQDGTVEPVHRIRPSEINYTDTRQSRIYVIKKETTPKGYIELKHHLKIKEKVTF